MVVLMLMEWYEGRLTRFLSVSAVCRALFAFLCSAAAARQASRGSPLLLRPFPPMMIWRTSEKERVRLLPAV